MFSSLLPYEPAGTGDSYKALCCAAKRRCTPRIVQLVDVYLVIRQSDERSGDGTIRWMNVRRYLNSRKNKKSRQIIFDGEELNMRAVWELRDEFFPPGGKK